MLFCRHHVSGVCQALCHYSTSILGREKISPKMSQNNEPQGCLTKILKLFGISLGPKSAEKEMLPYRLKDNILSPAELSFFKVLQQAVQAEVKLCPKVNLGDLFYVSKPHGNLAYRNKIDRKHVDFLLCDSKTIKPLLGVELDDASHLRKDRQARDQFVDSVFEAAGLPLLHVKVARGYRVPEIAELIQYHMKETSVNSLKSKVQNGTPLCPKCETPMVLRTATKGKRKGQEFWGCSNYPQCRGTVIG